MTRQARQGPGRERILEAALELAEENGWDGVRLHTIARHLDCSLSDILEHYRDQDAIADAWFRRGWENVARPLPPEISEAPVVERLETVMMRWFDALSPHRHVTGQMLRTKIYPSHPHHWVPMIFNLSRTIHWFREAALMTASGRQRQREEVGLTLLFLATLRVWLKDESPEQERTRAFLRHRLARADRFMARMAG